MIPWKYLLSVPGVLSIIISLILLTQPLITIHVPEITITQELYSCENTTPLRVEHNSFLFIIPVTEAHQSIKNTDNLTGTFKVNFIFDNGIERETTLEEVTLIPNQEATVSSSKWFLSGNVDVTANIIPPTRPVRHVKLVDKQVTGWEFLSTQFKQSFFGQ